MIDLRLTWEQQSIHLLAGKKHRWFCGFTLPVVSSHVCGEEIPLLCGKCHAVSNPRLSSLNKEMHANDHSKVYYNAAKHEIAW